MSCNHAIEKALEYHQAGHLSQAEAIYRQVLCKQPNPNALHLLGMIAHQTGNHDSAIELISSTTIIGQVIRLNSLPTP